MKISNNILLLNSNINIPSILVSLLNRFGNSTCLQILGHHALWYKRWLISLTFPGFWSLVCHVICDICANLSLTCVLPRTPHLLNFFWDRFLLKRDPIFLFLARVNTRQALVQNKHMAVSPRIGCMRFRAFEETNLNNLVLFINHRCFLAAGSQIQQTL